MCIYMRLPASSPAQVWHASAVRVGNFRGEAPAPFRSFVLELSDGKLVKVDEGQLVDVWAEHPSDGAPNGTAAWTAMHARSANLVRQLPPHMLDLRPLWQKLSLAKKHAAPVTTEAVASALFGNGGTRVV